MHVTKRVQASMTLCVAVMASRMAVCANWKLQPVPLGGRSEWLAEDPVTAVGSAALEPCVKLRLGAVCAPPNVWPQPSLCVALTGAHMPVNVNYTCTPAHVRSVCTWPQPVPARPVETQCVPLGLCAQRGSACVPGVSALHPAPCVAVMA